MSGHTITRSLVLLMVGVMVWLGALVSVASATVSVRFGDIVVKQEPSIVRTNLYHGYAETRFSVKNLSKTKTSTVKFSIIGDASRQFHIRDLRHSVVVGPNSRVMVPILQPSVTFYASYLQVSVDNGQEGGSMRLRSISRSTRGHRRKNVVVLLGAQIKALAVNCSKGLTNVLAFNKFKKSYQQFKFSCIKSTIPSTEWGKSWLGLTGYDGIVLRASEVKAMSASGRNALFRFAEVGGTVAVLGKWSGPKHWPEGKAVLVSSGPSSVPLNYFPGFGRVVVYPDLKHFLNMAPWKLRGLAGDFYESLSPFKKTLDMGRANTLFPVIDNLKIPVRGIFFVMLLFSLAIGPLNLWLLWRKKKRIMMLVTVPTAALLTCFLVFGYALLSEGWEGYERTESVTILDQTSKRATTLGWSAFYMPITPGSGLQFSYNTELSPQFRNNFWRGSGRALQLDWSKGQSLASGWIASRLPLHLKFRKNQVRRERLVVSQSKSGTLKVTNGLGSTIKQLWLADQNGKLYRLRSPLAPGAKRTLTAWKSMSNVPTINSKKKLSKFRNLFSDKWFKAKYFLTLAPRDYLRPGSYIADMEHSPFVDSHKGKVGELREKAVIIGLWKGVRHGS